MGAINNAFNKASLSILYLASATAKYRAMRNEEGQNRAKQSYSTAATIKKQNNQLTKNNIEQVTEKKVPQRFGELAGVEETFKQADAPTEKEVVEAKKPVQSFGELAGVEEAPATSFGELPTVNPEMDEQKIAEQKVLGQMAEEKTKAASFSELPTVSAEHSETNISAKDPEVQGLIEVKQKNALRAAAGKRSQERYQNIKGKLTSIVADYSYIDDAWREISLDPNITDEMIKKSGYTKTKILEEWKWFKDSPSDWMQRMNNIGGEYGIGGNEADADDFSNYDFGGMLSAYIKAKAGGKTLAQQQEEYELSKAEKEPEENYKVWQDDSTEEAKDEVKTNRNFDGIMF